MSQGFTPLVSAAAARAWLEAGLVKKRNSKMKSIFMIFRVHPLSIMSPPKIRPAANVSISPAACSLVKKSGSLRSPKHPIRRNKLPVPKRIMLRISMMVIIIVSAARVEMLFSL